MSGLSYQRLEFFYHYFAAISLRAYKPSQVKSSIFLLPQSMNQRQLGENERTLFFRLDQAHERPKETIRSVFSYTFARNAPLF